MSISRAEGSVVVNSTLELTATTVPEGSEVTWTSSNDEIATVADGVVTGVATGEATITATITVGVVDYTDTCTVTVTAE